MHRREHANRSLDNRIHPTLTQGTCVPATALGTGRNPTEQVSPSTLAASCPGAVRKEHTIWWPIKDRRKRRDAQLDSARA